MNKEIKIFIIYLFEDLNKVKKLENYILNNTSFEVLYLNQKHDFLWKNKAKALIKKSDVILILTSLKSRKSKNVDWEINYSNKQKKELIKVNIYEFKKNNLSYLMNQLNKKNNSFKETLYNNKATVFTKKEKLIVFEQYKSLLATSESLITRRQTMNTFFLSANGVLLTALGLLSNISNKYSFLYLLGIGITGILLCFCWRSLLISYGQLNKGKFDVLLEIEKQLPLSIFKAEWEALGKGKDKKKYKSFTKSEKTVPVVFGFIYIIYFISILIFNLIAICK